MRQIIFGMCLLFATTVAYGQPEKKPPLSSEDAYEKKYQKRIKKEYIYGVYIPKDLTDAFIQLNKLIDDETKAKFKSVDETTAVRALHFSFGRWMIYNWGFYEGSRLSHFLKQIGIHHPDDMARFLIITYHRNLNKKELNVKELATTFKETRQNQVNKRKKRGTVLHEETRKREN